MKAFSEAFKIIESNLNPLGSQKVLLIDSLNRVLAEDVFSDINVPPFNKANMDGFACKKEDLPGPFKIIEDIPVGQFSHHRIDHGECSRIMNGAPVPAGADTVFTIEQHEIQPDGSVLFTRESTVDNISLVGEDAHVDDCVLTKGTLIKAEEIAILATAGKSSVDVYSRPKVGVLSTGSELVEPYEKMELGYIRNSNASQLLAQLKGMNAVSEYFGIVDDSKEEMSGKIQSALKLVDVLLISGGVSVGDHDYIPQVLQGLGFDILFTSTAIKPGKYTLFAKKDDKYILGLPGNPISSYVQMEFFGKFLLTGLMGHQMKFIRYNVVFIDDFNRNDSDRMEFLPVRMTPSGKAQLLPYNGSAHIHALSKADALMEIPIGVSVIEKGDLVRVIPF